MRNDVISQVEIENEILRLLKILEAETEAFEKLAVDEAQKSAASKRDWASAYLAAKGAVKEREAWADYQCEQQNHDAKMAEGLLKAKREKLSSLRTSLDNLRTLNANVRAQVQ